MFVSNTKEVLYTKTSTSTKKDQKYTTTLSWQVKSRQNNTSKEAAQQRKTPI